MLIKYVIINDQVPCIKLYGFSRLEIAKYITVNHVSNGWVEGNL